MEVTLPKTGKEARKLGINRYFTGVPCLRGHISERAAHNGQCLGCAKIASQANGQKRVKQGLARAYYEKQRTESPEKIMLMSAKNRARKTGCPCRISAQDIRDVWPKDGMCPVFGIRLKHNYDSAGSHSPVSPSLDKIKPELGYVVGNIVVMSMMANRIKNDITDPEIFRKIANWIERN